MIIRLRHVMALILGHGRGETVVHSVERERLLSKVVTWNVQSSRMIPEKQSLGTLTK